MSRSEIARRAARAALFQRRHGAGDDLRILWTRAYSLLRSFHHTWSA